MSENTPLEQLERREVKTTRAWGIGIIITIVVQTIGVVWFASAQNAKFEEAYRLTQQNAKDIIELKTSSPVILTRENLNDILLPRDNDISSLKEDVRDLQATANRIEQAVNVLKTQ